MTASAYPSPLFVRVVGAHAPCQITRGLHLACRAATRKFSDDWTNAVLLNAPGHMKWKLCGRRHPRFIFLMIIFSRREIRGIASSCAVAGPSKGRSSRQLCRLRSTNRCSRLLCRAVSWVIPVPAEVQVLRLPVRGVSRSPHGLWSAPRRRQGFSADAYTETLLRRLRPREKSFNHESVGVPTGVICE